MNQPDDIVNTLHNKLQDDMAQVHLDGYRNMVSGLLHSSLLRSSDDNFIRETVRRMTLSTFETLDGRRKTEMFKFLVDSHLIDQPNPVALLDGADLSGANLFNANLAGAKLVRSNFTETVLFMADLTGADLTEATLTRANLTGAKLAQANLTRADLRGARLDLAITLTEASLDGADLRGCLGLTPEMRVYAKHMGALIDEAAPFVSDNLNPEPQRGLGKITQWITRKRSEKG